MKRLLLLLAVLATATTATPAAAQEPVGPADLRPHLEALRGIAQANGNNRAAGMPGGSATSEYIAAKLREAGWNVQLQPVPFPFYAPRRNPVLGSLRFGRDFTVTRYSPPADGSGRLRVFLRESCSPRYLRPLRRGDVAFFAYTRCSFRTVTRRAKRQGASAVIVIGSDTEAPLTPTTFAPSDLALPVFVVSDVAGARLVERHLRGRRLGVRVDAATEQRTADNVIADLPGTANGRVVMAGGHLDSVPEGPGLNDNGSGVAALLEMARRLAAAPRGADTLRLGFWTAEEWGLYGSKHYVRTLPPPERRRIQAYVNLDMVGSPNAVTEVYSSRNAATTALRKGLPGVGTTPVAAASDHLPFRDRGIAVSGVYTGSTETKSRAQARRLGGRAGRPRDRCYHRVCDDVDNVDTKLAARIATAAARALAELARR